MEMIRILLAIAVVSTGVPQLAAAVPGAPRVAPSNVVALQFQLKNVETQIANLRNFMTRGNLSPQLASAYQLKLKQLEASRDHLRRQLGIPEGDLRNVNPPEKKGAPAPNGKHFPAHWGAPPLRQTRDLRTLPGGYGRGSGTLAKWIQGNIDRDKAKAKNGQNQKKPNSKPDNKKENNNKDKKDKKFTATQVNAVRFATNFDRRVLSLPGIIGVGVGGRNNNDAWINVVARDKNSMANAQKYVGAKVNGVPVKFQVVETIKVPRNDGKLRQPRILPVQPRR
tara:strand:- start:571 stop:1413 length:843 start_codon:yes stop_codon:yes gene_type:complete